MSPVPEQATRPVLTKIAGKFQVTVPPEIRSLFALREGDLLEWSFDPKTSLLVVTPKRAQLITAQLEQRIEKSKRVRSESKVPA